MDLRDISLIFQVTFVPDPISMEFIDPSLLRIHNFASFMFPLIDITYSVTGVTGAVGTTTISAFAFCSSSTICF